MGRNNKEFDGRNFYEKEDKWWTSVKKAINQARAVKPSNVHGQNDWRTEFYRQQIRMIIKTIIDVKVSDKYNDDWDIDYFKDILLFEGKIAIGETSAGLLPLKCGLFGVNVFERCKGVQIANPIVGNYTWTIGENCEVIFLMDDKWCHNFSPIIDIYACKLAMCDSSIDVNLINSKVAYIVDCSGKKQADEAKMLLDKINNGEPAVFYENDGLNTGSTMQFFKNDVKGSFVIDMIQDAKRAIMNELLTLIGVNNSAVEKKERLLVDEVNGNNMEVQCNMAYVKEMVEKCVDRANKMFPDLKLKITFPFFETASMSMQGGELDDSRRSLTGRIAVEKDQRSGADA